HHGAAESELLPLAATEVRPAVERLADQGVQSVRQPLEDILCSRPFNGSLYCVRRVDVWLRTQSYDVLRGELILGKVLESCGNPLAPVLDGDAANVGAV